MNTASRMTRSQHKFKSIFPQIRVGSQDAPPRPPFPPSNLSFELTHACTTLRRFHPPRDQVTFRLRCPCVRQHRERIRNSSGSGPQHEQEPRADPASFRDLGVARRRRVPHGEKAGKFEMVSQQIFCFIEFEGLSPRP